MKRLEYTHLKTDEDVLCIAGYYTPSKEARLKYKDREVLYVLGQAVMSSCCGAGCWEYALVPGYVVRWQSKTGEAGLPVSDVEPVADKAAQTDISRILKETESVSQVDFW